ncbi:hypothetical protein FBU31_000778 [Coemansia sp. 'formosensis']|nr:hypothetical protein FBU31_000778 [Coemansia sp. 'formosensis']
MSELALSQNNILAPARSPNSVLHLVIGYLSPVPGPNCALNELLVHLRRLQVIAAVNREWRVAALPLFYCTAYLDIGHPLDMYDSDDDMSFNNGDVDGSNDNDGMSIDNEDDSDEGDEGDMGVDGGVSTGANEANIVSGGDFWSKDEDEDLLNTIGLSWSGVDIRRRSNIEIILAAGSCVNVRELRITVQGKGQTAGQLLRQLHLSYFGRYEWPTVERLRIDMRGSSRTAQTNTTAVQGPMAIKELNSSLSESLPSLREIEFYGPHSKALYGCVLIEQLIKERLQWPASLHAVRVKSDCWPQLTDDYTTGVADTPIFIECMEIDAPDDTFLIPIPIMVSDALVELKLTFAIADYEWSLFEYMGDLDTTEQGSDTSKPLLIFSSLKSLMLDPATDIRDLLEHRLEHPRYPYRNTHYCSGYHYHGHGSECDCQLFHGDANHCQVCFERTKDESGDEEGEDGDKLYYNDIAGQLSTRFKDLPKYDSPMFPVLTHLEFRDRVCRWDLEMFAASPISALVLCSLTSSFNECLDISIFSGLRRLSVRLTCTIGKSDASIIDKLFATVCSSLQHLTLSLAIKRNWQLQLKDPPFADSLVSLTLEGEYGQSYVECLLQLFRNLCTFSVCAIFSEPIFSVSELVDKYRCANGCQSLTPLNSSLRALDVYGKRYFSGYYDQNSAPGSMRLMASELHHYRSMLVSLACRLPALDMLRVGAQSVDGVNESICALVDTNVGLGYINRLQRLRVRPLDY